MHHAHAMPWAYCIALGLLMAFLSVQHDLERCGRPTCLAVAVAGGLFVLLGVALLAATLGA